MMDPGSYLIEEPALNGAREAPWTPSRMEIAPESTVRLQPNWA